MTNSIIDGNGIRRQCGLLEPDPAFVCSLPVFENAIPLWSDSEIMEAASDPAQVMGRNQFAKFVRDQKQQSSCNSFASVGGYSITRRKAGIVDDKVFSTAFTYSLMNHGRDGGSALSEGLQVSLATGFCEESIVPYEQIFPHLQPRRAEALADAAKHRAMIAYAVETKQGFYTALAKGFVVIVAVSAGGNFSNPANGYAKADSGKGNHAILSVDLTVKDGKLWADTLNSWGDDYGAGGFVYLGWESFAQTLPIHSFWALAATEE